MKHLLLKFLRSEDGPTAVEYAVMLALIMGVCIGSIGLVGQETRDSVDHSKTKIQESFEDAGVGNF
jgi:pilus assembly protein Flp/PilA